VTGLIGKRTACGGILRRDSIIIAHRKLPCGTRLKIRNPRNGRSVVGVVWDRGPGTIASLDLGPGIWKAIGMKTSINVCVSSPVF